MAGGERLICSSGEIAERGPGFRFTLLRFGREEPAFAIRYQGRVRGFMNRCAHTPIELDWVEGEFFDDEGRWIICATHGALYDPETGACAGGRCAGRGLEVLTMIEREGGVYVVEQEG